MQARGRFGDKQQTLYDLWKPPEQRPLRPLPADHIYVLHNGRLVEQGAHDDLMLLKGQYAELFNLQAAAYQPAAPDSVPR